MKWICLPVLALVAGCIGENDETLAGQGSKTCDPATFEFLVGQPKEVVDGITTPERVRVLGENDAMTMDYHPDRLNVIHDDAGKIVKITCG